MLLWYIYVQPISRILFCMVLALVLWAVAGWGAAKRQKWARVWRALNLCLLSLTVAAALYVTLAREPSAERSVMLIPFYSFIAAFEQPEHYRMLLMNTFLFLPLGLTFANALPSSMPMKKRFLITVSGGLLLSLLIECLQFAFCLGTAQVDDLLFNTLGAVLGVCSLSGRRWLCTVKALNKS